MKIKQQPLFKILFMLTGTVLLFYVLRYSVEEKDFQGYIAAGKLVLSGKFIYSEFLNTWPPFFSIFCVPLAWLDGISKLGIRFVWLLGSVFAMYGIVSLTVRLFLQKKLTFPFLKESTKPTEGHISFLHPLVFIPFLISFRFLLDNLQNIQINVYLLLLCLATIYFFTQNKMIPAGLLLALGISLKVFPVFIFLFFVFKREWKMVGWTIIFLVFINAISFLVYGFEEALGLYQYFFEKIASPLSTIHHKNQSVFGMVHRFLSANDPGIGFHVNFMDLDPHLIKRIAYGVIAIAGLAPAYFLRKKIGNKRGQVALLEYSILFTAIPILSPLAWKAYFIFLWVPYFVVYGYLFHTNLPISLQKLKWLKGLFWASVVFNILSSEIFMGNYFSDVLETLSCIVVGTGLLLVIQLVLYLDPAPKVRSDSLL